MGKQKKKRLEQGEDGFDRLVDASDGESDQEDDYIPVSQWRMPDDPQDDDIPSYNYYSKNKETLVEFKNDDWVHKISPVIQEKYDRGESLEYEQLQVDYYAEPTSGKPVIRSYGTDWDGNTFSVYIHGFEPYFYIPSTEWNDDSNKFIRCILPELEARHDIKKGRRPWITRIEKVSKLPLADYQTEFLSFFKIYVGHPSYVATLRIHLENKEGLTRPKTKVQIETYESNTAYVIRFLVDKKISGSSWVRIQNYKKRNPHETYDNIEVDIHCDDIQEADDPDPKKKDQKYLKSAPHRIMSFDIECKGDGEHFPNPKRDPVITIACVVTPLGKEAEKYTVPEIDPKTKKPKQKMRTNAEHFVIFQLRSCAPVPNAVVYAFDDPRDLLLSFRDFFIQINPRIVTGYNHECFDVPYMMKWAKALGIEDTFSQLGVVRGERSRIREEVSESNQRGMRKKETVEMRGRVYFDPMVVYRAEVKLPSYTLNAVSSHFLGEQKEKMHHNQIPIYFDGDEKSRAKIAKYCGKDALLPLWHISERKLILNAILVSRVTGVPLSYVYGRGQIVRIVSQLLREINTMDFIIPVSIFRQLEILYGAHVFDPISGFYQKGQPVATLDFASLYPSIMIAYNLCLTTRLRRDAPLPVGLDPTMVDEFFVVIPDEDDEDTAERIKKMDQQQKKSEEKDQKMAASRKGHVEVEVKPKTSSILELSRNDTTVKKKVNRSTASLIDKKNKKNGDDVKQSQKIDSFFVKKRKTIDEGTNDGEASVINDSRELPAPKERKRNGFTTRFVRPGVRKGVLPTILIKLLAARKEAKRMAAKYAVDGECPDSLLYTIYDTLQSVLKVCANSIYGACGAAFGPIYMPDIGNTVTGRGRHLIQLSAEWVCKNMPGSIILYGDTDSIMVRFAEDNTLVVTIEDAMRLGTYAAKEITKFINLPPVSLTFEKVYSPYLLHLKKKYVGQKWTISEKDGTPLAATKLDFKGLETARRDFAPLTGKTMDTVTNILFRESDVEKATQYARNVVQSLYENTYDLEDLIFTRTFSKEIEDYENDQPHIALIRRKRKRDPSYEAVIGDRIPYIIIENEIVKSISFSSKGIKSTKALGTCDKSEDPIYAEENDLPIDVKYYVESQLEKPLRKILLPVLGTEAKLYEVFHGAHTRHKVSSSIATPTDGLFTSGLVEITKRCVSCHTLLGRGDSNEALCLNCMGHIGEKYNALGEEHDVKMVLATKLWNKCFVCAEITCMAEDKCKTVDCEQIFKRKRVLKRIAQIKDIQGRLETDARKQEIADIEDLFG
jgi:DNA polymerase elongation subunit (family B)